MHRIFLLELIKEDNQQKIISGAMTEPIPRSNADICVKEHERHNNKYV